jgi:hypothetical protein
MTDMLDLFLKYVIFPVAGFVWMLHTKLQAHSTKLAVMEAQIEASKQAQDREFRDMRRIVDAIFSKLDGIEAALRK